MIVKKVEELLPAKYGTLSKQFRVTVHERDGNSFANVVISGRPHILHSARVPSPFVVEPTGFQVNEIGLGNG